jgi:hypothetical protein
MANVLHPDDFDDSPEDLQRLSEVLTRRREDPDALLRDLRQLLTVKGSDLLGLIGVPQMAAIAAITHGHQGIRLLADAARNGEDTHLRRIALEALWTTSKGQPSPFYAGGTVTQPAVEEDLRLLASDILDDLIVESPQQPDLFAACLQLAVDVEIKEGFAARFMRVSADATIRLTRSLLDEFADLIDSNRPESDYQEFLQQNPALLDPLAADVYPTAQLGLEFKTDFVIRRHDGRYIVVEIEKPQDRLSTAQRDFAAPMTHAVGQVMDFQQWVADNIAYAQTRLPGIVDPAGLLVMGRRAGLEGRATRKLARWQINSRHIDLVTYDELLDRGRALLRSLRH